MAAWTLACAPCHGAQGEGTKDAYFPCLAGKPAGYLYNQLEAFKDGRRHYPPMNYLLAYLSDNNEIERFFERLLARIAEQPPLPQSLRLGANVLTATTLKCMGEVLALLRKSGVDEHRAYDVLTNSLFDSHVHKIYGGKIIEGRFGEPNFPAPLAIKDLKLALAEAESFEVPMPAAGLVHDHLIELVTRGWDKLDWSALGLLAAVNAGLDSGRFERWLDEGESSDWS